MKILLMDILLEQLVHVDVSKPENNIDITGLSNRHMMNKTWKNISTGKSNRNIRPILVTNTLLD